MNIINEATISGRAIAAKPPARPVRMIRWFIIVGLALALLVGGLVWFNGFRGEMIKQILSNRRRRRRSPLPRPNPRSSRIC